MFCLLFSFELLMIRSRFWFKLIQNFTVPFKLAVIQAVAVIQV